MRFPALKCSFPIVFVHVFILFSIKVEQNETERSIFSRFGLGIMARTKDTCEKSHLRNPGKFKHWMS